VQGRKAYEMARKGEEVDLEPRKITVHHLEVLEWAPPEVVIDVHCSSGTYVRSLANDLGKSWAVVHISFTPHKSGASPCEMLSLRRLQEPSTPETGTGI
jgi:tRNA pseudouridine(55) synthase